MSLERGQIYFVNLNPVQGKEQSGARSVLILSVDEINRKQMVTTVIPGTKELSRQPLIDREIFSWIGVWLCQ